jgi:hypothetical protein
VLAARLSPDCGGQRLGPQVVEHLEEHASTAVIDDSEHANVGAHLEQLHTCRREAAVAVAVADDQESRVGLLDSALERGPSLGLDDLDLVLGKQPSNQIAEHAPTDHDNAWAFHLAITRRVSARRVTESMDR